MSTITISKNRSMIGQRIQDERKRLNLSQQEMADLCGITSRSQRNYENGDRVPDINYLTAAHAAGADIRYITEGVYRFDEIGRRLAEERNRVGKTLSIMAALGGIDVQQQLRFESGIDHPPAEYLNRLNAAVQIGNWYILTGEPDSGKNTDYLEDILTRQSLNVADCATAQSVAAFAQSHTMTPEKVKEQLRSDGKTIVEVAHEKNLNLKTVYSVLNGVNKGYRGEAHRVAVALGLKK